MLRPTPWRPLHAFLLLCAVLSAQDASATQITYLTGSTVYLDAGSSSGIAVGDTVAVWRDGELLGSLVVDYTSSGRATCSLEGVAFAPEVGDEIRFDPSEPRNRVENVAVVEDIPASAVWKGRVGLRFMGVRTRQDYGQDFDQPAGDLRLSGRGILGGAWNLEIDARARHTYRRPVNGASSDLSLNRIYRSFLEWAPGETGSSIVVGRQASPELSNISIFDGLSATLRRERWSAGLVGGTQPSMEDFGLSSEVLEFGAFYRRQTPRDQSRRWELALAGIASYEESEIDREYIYLQGSMSDPRFLVFATQELDLNRGWKKDYTSDAISPTATYIFGRYRFRPEFSLRAGFDNRRRVRLWTDRDTPESQFDESFRQGFWVGADSRLARVWYLGLDFRGSSGGSAGSADVISFRANWIDVRRFPVRVGGRVSLFGNDHYDGQLYSMDLGWDATHQLRFDLEAGMRLESHDGFVQEDTDNNWLRLDAEFGLRSGWYLNLTGEWTRGGIDASDLYQTSVNYRF